MKLAHEPMMEPEDFEAEEKRMEELRERHASINSIRYLLEHLGRSLSADWGELAFEITDECSYDLGKVHGMQLALAALESMTGLWPDPSDRH